MKRKYYWIILILFAFSYTNVDASSIEYNLTVDNDLELHENIIYKVKKSELDTSGNYDFLTSVVNEKTYFDIDGEVPYTKTKNLVNNEYTVVLKNNFYPLFASKQRIVNECFSKFNFVDNEDKLSINLESPFYCLHRADNIKVNIKTDLYVSNSNADSVSGNIYTWNVEDKDFDLRFSAQIPESESEPMDSIDENTSADATSEEESNQVDEPNDTENNVEEENSIIGTVIGVIVLIIVLVGGLITFIILKNKNSNLNKI